MRHVAGLRHVNKDLLGLFFDSMTLARKRKRRRWMKNDQEYESGAMRRG